MKRTTVLIADHHHNLRRSIREFFHRLPNFEVIGELESGGELEEKIRELQPDLLIIDIEFPVINGMEIARRVRREGLPTQVFITTMFEDPIYSAQALEAGARGIIAKSQLKLDLDSKFKFHGVFLGRQK
jgi:DNA-binding NarL/FixJ family response regulator